jgi:hypothetical protein
MRYVVIENTPGYLDDEPFETDDYAEAVAYLNERAEEYEALTGEYADSPDGPHIRVERGIASGDNLAAVMIYDDSKTHDRGRYIGVERADLGD